MTLVSGEKVSERSQPVPVPDGLSRPLSIIRRRLGLLKWLLPAGLLLIVIVYEIGPAQWIRSNIGDAYDFWSEVVVYGSIGPLLAFALLHFLGRWLEERETSDLQALVLAQARQRAEIGHQLSDDVLQSLFAVSTLLASLEAHASELPPDAQAQLRKAQATLNQTVQQLHAYLHGSLNRQGDAESRR